MQAQSKAEGSSVRAAVERYFEVMLYLMVLSGFGTLAQTGQLDPITVLLMIGALTVRGYFLAARKTFLIAERWTKYLTLVFAIWYFVDCFWISGAFVAATVHLVLALMVVRLFSAYRNRDFVFLAILSFLLILAASVLTVDSAFLIGFAAYLLCAAATFIMMEIRRSGASATVFASDNNGSAEQLGKSLGGLTPVLVCSILVLALVIFFLLPRISAGYLSAYAPAGQLTTGFSDRVDLGRIGQIQQSNAVVMHVAIEGDKSGRHPDLLWRGVALNNFDGTSWSNNDRQTLLPRLPDGRFIVPRPEDLNASGSATSTNKLRYRVLLEALGTNVMFLAPRTQTIEGAYSILTTDDGGAVYDLDRNHPPGLYEADSDLQQTSPEELRSAYHSPPSLLNRKYLQLPPLDPRIADLARQITASTTNDYDRSVAIESYLRSRYGYTLQLGTTVPKDPLAYFLFERRQGHCEYFASSMAVMLRVLGIPSRVVNGFRTGEFNDITSQYLVRMRNAHSWVEAYFPGYGWIGFDPTPGDGFASYGTLGRFSLYLDAASSFWREWVINYDFHHQQTLGHEATTSGRQIFDCIREWNHQHYDALLIAAHRMRRRMVHAPGRWTAGAIAALLMLLLAINFKAISSAIRTRRLAQHPARAPQLAASIWYQRMIRMLARRGWRKAETQTPAEFAATIEDSEVQLSVERFTSSYEKARFGNSADEAQRLPELYDEISSRR